MDTTLRDGEQTSGVSFSAFEKLQIASYLLEKLKVNRIEVASARVSPEEFHTVKKICEWAKQNDCLEKIEVLGFIDKHKSIEWIKGCGGKVLNLLCKGSKNHCEKQLRITLKQHLKEISATIKKAVNSDLKVNVYLEDWSNGYLHSHDYLIELTAALVDLPVNSIFLPDTLGILSPKEVYEAVSDMVNRHPSAFFEFHGHNDYNLATANCLAAVEAGAQGLHVAINGLGERAGNAPLESVVVALHDKLGVKTTIKENAIMGASRLVETFSDKRIQSNRPIVGKDVYTQTAGIHADGDEKAKLYSNPILPERFGRKRVYALGKLAGKASVKGNLNHMGIKLSTEQEKLLLERIKQLGEEKKRINPDDLPFLVQDMFGKVGNYLLTIENAVINTSLNAKPTASIALQYKSKLYKANAEGDGGYDAFMNALQSLLEFFPIKLDFPILRDYEVHIPPGGKTNALVEAIIDWENESLGLFSTSGLDTDQLRAAIKATEKMLNRLVL